ncbi:MAG TPA: TatD family hydrolase, partial [Saprospiraceae bacterium]|nr:TatD family hydrolase [Saprospiraceae bacterium]
MQSNQIHWTDTHCHIYVPEFDSDQAEMMERATEAGVTRMMMPNIDLESVERVMTQAGSYPGHCFPMMGLHPCSVKEDYKTVLGEIEKLLFHGKYIGVGETGIDLYWDTTFKQQQIEAFELQIDWALQLGLPVIIHSRESLDLNIEIISRKQDGRLRGIFHCFGGSLEQAHRIHELGFKIGIGGTVTYKNSTLPSVLPEIPSSMIVLETDAPYLTPVPFRGKRNESSYIPIIAAKVADILQVSMVELSGLTNENAAGV